MKLIAVKIVVGGLILSPTPASAVPRWVEDLCWYHANRVLPALDYRERAAYIANCKANYLAGSPPPPGQQEHKSLQLLIGWLMYVTRAAPTACAPLVATASPNEADRRTPHNVALPPAARY